MFTGDGHGHMHGATGMEPNAQPVCVIDVDAQGRSAAKVALDRGFEQCALAMYQASKEEDQARVLRGAGRAGRGMK